MNNIKSKDVKIISIQDLRENPKNRNNHPEAQLKVLEKIIKDNGFREPIIVSSRSGYIVAGHARLTVAKRLGFTEVPVSIQDFDSDEAEMKHLIASNEIARYAEFDKDNFLKDFNVDLKGIDFELYGLIDFKLPRIEVVPGCDEDEQVVFPKTSPITKNGDVWILDNHRLMCGNSTMVDDVTKLMGGKKAQISFTSPPYNAGDEVKTGLIACEKLQRDYFGMDMDPLYVDTTIMRWQKYSGKTAKLESTGETYNDLKGARSN